MNYLACEMNVTFKSMDLFFSLLFSPPEKTTILNLVSGIFREACMLW